MEESKRLKDYRGYAIEKVWEILPNGKQDGIFYAISKEYGEDIITTFDTLRECKKYIDNIIL